MDKIIERKSKIQEAIDKETNENKKRVLEEISKLITISGEYYYGDIFEGEEELKSDKNFVRECIKFNPETYDYITPELQDDREVLFTLAGSPIYYNALELGDYGSYAHCPLHKILNANSFYRKKDKNPIVTDDRREINDEGIILEALKAEIESFEYCEVMENEKNPIIRYKGLEIFKALKTDKNITFSDCKSLLSLSYATEEIMNNNEFQRKVMGILQRWKENMKNKSELETREEVLSLLEAEEKSISKALMNKQAEKEGQGIGEE